MGGKRYQLAQFHFHCPSEEYIHGKPYDMEVHLMHEASDGKVVVVAVLLRAGSANATIQKIWDHMPGAAGNEKEIAGVEVNPADLLPRDAALPGLGKSSPRSARNRGRPPMDHNSVTSPRGEVLVRNL